MSIVINNLESSNSTQENKTTKVEFVGIDELNIDNFITASIKHIAKTSFEKIKNIIQQDASLKVHIKRHFAGNNYLRNKYSVALHFEYSGNRISIGNTTEWDLKEALKNSLEKLETRINKIFMSQGLQSRNSLESKIKK